MAAAQDARPVGGTAWHAAAMQEKMGVMLSIQMNDDAVRMLDMPGGLRSASLPGELGPGLENILRRGIVRRGQVLVWASSTGDAAGAPSFFPDLTGWECSDSSFHIEDFVVVDVATVDDCPVIGEADQRTLLIHGLSFSLRFARLVYSLAEAGAVRCIIGANETNATFRFHQIREGEQWNAPDLDDYELEKIIVIDISPGSGITPRKPSRRGPGGRRT